MFAVQNYYSILKRHEAKSSICRRLGVNCVCNSNGERYHYNAKNAMMMIHNPSALVWGQAEDMRQMADALDKIRESMIVLIKARST